MWREPDEGSGVGNGVVQTKTTEDVCRKICRMCRKHYCCTKENCESIIDCAIRASEKVFNGLCKKCGDSLTRRRSLAEYAIVPTQRDPVIFHEIPKEL